jgi:hypothetical protein
MYVTSYKQQEGYISLQHEDNYIEFVLYYKNTKQQVTILKQEPLVHNVTKLVTKCQWEIIGRVNMTKKK